MCRKMSTRPGIFRLNFSARSCFFSAKMIQWQSLKFDKRTMRFSMNQQEKTPLLQIFRAALILAVPIALQNLLTSCGSLVDAIMIVPLGNAATAAVGVSGRFTFLLNVVAFGFCSGSATLISQYWGANDRGGIHHTYGVAASFSLVFSLLFAAVLRFSRIFASGCSGRIPPLRSRLSNMWKFWHSAFRF